MANTPYFTKAESQAQNQQALREIKQTTEAISAGEGGKLYDTLVDAQAVDPKPVDGTVFTVSSQTDLANSGYYTFQSSEPNGTRFEREFDPAPTNITPSQLEYPSKLLANKEQIYPLVSLNESTLIDNNFTRNGILDVKIINAQRDSFYSIGYFANNHATFKDCIVIRRHSRVDGTIIEDVTYTQYKPELTLDRSAINVREISKERVNEEGFTTNINFTPGLQILITIDYSAIAEGTVWSSSSLNRDNRISDDCIISYSEDTEPQPEVQSIEQANLMLVKRTGEDLYISSKLSGSEDIIMHFRKCMFNNLYTFYQVGIKNNTDIFPAMPDSGIDTVLNTSTSDNIGPISVSGGGWAGANHSYQEEGQINTAESVSFEIFSDGIEVKDGDLLRSEKIEVRVINNIFNPLLPTEEGGVVVSLDQIMCVETVIYQIDKNTIKTMLTHSYQNTETVTVSYYGMQSMFNSETEIMTPRGAYKDFDLIANVTHFTKNDYPEFDRFIEKNANGYQSTYLLPYSNGNHAEIAGTDLIFVRSGGKSYHNLLKSADRISGDSTSWAGVYTWFKTPIQDDADVLVYETNNLLFIDVKRAFSGTVNLPSKYVLKDFSIESQDSEVTIGNDVAPTGITIDATAAGSVILKFN